MCGEVRCNVFRVANDQSARMRRLICAFAVRMQQIQFSITYTAIFIRVGSDIFLLSVARGLYTAVKLFVELQGEWDRCGLL